jgi:hypothetical protein
MGSQEIETSGFKMLVYSVPYMQQAALTKFKFTLQ